MRLALMACLLAVGLSQGADEVTIKQTSFEDLAKTVASHKGKVVVIDVWGTF